MVLGRVNTAPDCPIDQVLAAVMRAPATYTGEDTVEFQCHGGRVQVDGVLQALIAAGAVPALPGEFTFRAFLNGRMDLYQAESVADLISASTQAASKNALVAYGGVLHDRLVELADRLVRLRARLEAGIDFVDDDIPAMEHPQICSELKSASEVVDGLVDSYKVGRILREGARVVISGAPNSGKSSLFNAILKFNRSIVADVPGTTRDSVTEMIDLGGMPVILTDTAGLRESDDEIESEGIRRARELMTAADLVLDVIDLSSGVREQPALEGNGHLTVYNKSDLAPVKHGTNGGTHRSAEIAVSALTGEGVEELCRIISNRLGGSWLAGNEAAVTRQRQHKALVNCRDALSRAKLGLESSVPMEVVSVDLREASVAIDELVGRVYDEDILNRIFGEFCIGK
jgi:tRNA modification GTPase